MKAQTVENIWRPDRSQLLLDLFHRLNQPLTTLNCSLELALFKQRPLELDIVRQATVQVESFTQLTGCLRHLIAADDAGDRQHAVDLGQLLHSVTADLQPIAESLGVKMSVHCDVECAIWFDESRLRQALFNLLDLVIAATQNELILDLATGDRRGWIVLEIKSVLKDVPRETRPDSEDLAQQVALAAAYRTFESGAGQIVISNESNRLNLQIQLLASGTTAEKPTL